MVRLVVVNGCISTLFFSPILPPKNGQPKWKTRYSKCSDWKPDAFCKTRHAGGQGWEYFRADPLRVIELTDWSRAASARVAVHDEGGYWPTRSEAKLSRERDECDRCIAALGGVCKDAYGEGEVIAPVFGCKNFERLEHEGQQQFGGRIQPLCKALV